MLFLSLQLHRPEVKAASAILTHARRLRDALLRYRRAITRLDEDAGPNNRGAREPDDLPL